MPSMQEVAQLRAALTAAGYPPVPVQTSGKRPIGFAWGNQARLGKIDPPTAASLNTGVLCDGLRVVDIDVDDGEIASAIAELARDMLGDAPEKFRSNSGRRTLVYRAAEGEPKKRSVIGDKGKVEVLGHGQQFVAFGLHPSGAELQWRDRPLYEVIRADLAAVTEDGVAAFLAMTAGLVGAPEPVKPVSAPAPALVVRTGHSDALPPAGADEIEDLLWHIPADCDYQTWLETLMALHAAGASVELADQWSATGGAKYAGTKEVEKKWRSFKRSGVTSRTLAMIAKRYGADLAAVALEHNTPPDDGYDTAPLLNNFLARRAAEEDRAIKDFLIPASSFAGLPTPTREFLDERSLIPMRNVTMLSGDGGTGKSLIAMQLAMAVSTGSIWLGKRVRLGSVVYFSAEDDEAETHIRMKEICAADNLDISVMHELGIAVMAGRDAVLAAEDTRSAMMKRTKLWETLCAAVYTEKPALVVLDNLADIFAGNENSRPLARQFVGMLRGLAMEAKCAVVLLSHPSVAGMSSGTGTSGNTAWSNSVRSRLYLRRNYQQNDDRIEEDDPNLRVLETKKANYGQIGGEVRVRWEGGRFVAVADPAEAAVGDPLAHAMKAERVFMHLLKWHLRHGKNVSPNKSVSYAPKVFAAHPQSEGVRLSQFERAIVVLLEQRQIMIYDHGSPARPRQSIRLPIGVDLE
jgi:RecA-family ATPase